MEKNYDALKDLTTEQLRAQVKLCFKFMAQCKAILDGEDIDDNAAIKLVDPFGNSDDMELFYACKSAVDDPTLADALETIRIQDKKINRLQKRLAKKHDAEMMRVALRENPLAVLRVNLGELKPRPIPTFFEELKNFRFRPSEKILENIRRFAHEINEGPKPKYKNNDKVFFMAGNIVKEGRIFGSAESDNKGFCYRLYSPDGRYQAREECLFPSLEDLFNDLKEKLNGGKH